MPKEKLNIDVNIFENISEDFFSRITSINKTLYFTMAILNIKHDNLIESMEKDYGDIDKIDSKNLSLAEHKELNKRLDELRASSHSHDFIQKGIFMDYVAEINALLGNLIRLIYKKRPDIIESNCSKVLSYNDLLKIGDIEQGKNFIMESNVYDLTHGSPTDIIQKIQNLLNKESLFKNIDNYKNFIELIELRNIIFHNNSCITKQTLDVFQKHHIENNYNIGDNITLKKTILDKCFDTFLEVGIKVLYNVRHELLNKSEKKEIEDMCHSFNNICYDLMDKNKYELCKNMLERGLCTFTKMEEPVNLYYIMNQGLVLRLMKKIDESKKIISSINWAGKDCLFRLCAALLLDNYDDVYKYMRQYNIGEDEEKTKEMYKSQIIFRKLIVKKEFKKLYKEIFKEDFRLSSKEIIDKVKSLGLKDSKGKK